MNDSFRLIGRILRKPLVCYPTVITPRGHRQRFRRHSRGVRAGSVERRLGARHRPRLHSPASAVEGPCGRLTQTSTGSRRPVVPAALIGATRCCRCGRDGSGGRFCGQCGTPWAAARCPSSGTDPQSAERRRPGRHRSPHRGARHRPGRPGRPRRAGDGPGDRRRTRPVPVVARPASRPSLFVVVQARGRRRTRSQPRSPGDAPTDGRRPHRHPRPGRAIRRADRAARLAPTPGHGRPPARAAIRGRSRWRPAPAAEPGRVGAVLPSTGPRRSALDRIRRHRCLATSRTRIRRRASCWTPGSGTRSTPPCCWVGTRSIRREAVTGPCWPGRT